MYEPGEVTEVTQVNKQLQNCGFNLAYDFIVSEVAETWEIIRY